MISAIVIAPDLRFGDDPVAHRETIVRSLSWLVSAVVAGVVRDVVLAAPSRLDLADIVDQSGCDLVQAEREADRIAAALGAGRGQRLLVIKSGFVPEPGLVDELAAFLRRAAPMDCAIVSAMPQTLSQRLFPSRAPTVGVLLPLSLMPRARLSTPVAFGSLVKASRPAVRLASRARPIG